MGTLGGRNSGKGIIERSLSNTFNPYVVSFNSSNLISKKTLGEISKELAWMVDFEFSRLIFGSEIDQKLDKTGRNDIKFNGNEKIPTDIIKKTFFQNLNQMNLFLI